MPTLLSPSNMTAANAPSPFVASASSEYSGAYSAWRAFDGDTTTSGWAATSGTGWLQIDLGSAQWVASYQISFAVTGYGNSSAPNTWTFQGSPDGTTWTTLDTQSGQVFTNPQAISYTLATMGFYRYWRLNVTADNGSPNLAVGEFYLYGPAGTTAQTITFPAITSPTVAATASSGLTVYYSVTGPATISGSILTITGAGTITVQATQPGDLTYAAATPVSQSLTTIDFAPHNMTSDTAPSPFVALASSELSGLHSASCAFNVVGGGGLSDWLGTGAGVDWLQLDIGPGNSGLLFAYGIDSQDPARCPKNWVMQGSHDGSTWTTLDTKTGANAGFYTGAPPAIFQIASPGTTAFRYWRVNITANNGDPSYTQIDELYLYGTAGGTPVVPPNTQRGNIAFDQIKGTDRTGDGNQLLTWTTTVPATAGAAGNAGQIARDTGFVYFCVATNTWERVAIATW